jgi:hypothetical protein
VFSSMLTRQAKKGRTFLYAVPAVYVVRLGRSIRRGEPAKDDGGH